jgi:periplasmic divalent cation tolerance protein
MMENVRIVFVSLPREEAREMAKILVEERLAACVNIVPQIESYYRWEKGVQFDQESLLIIKSTAERFAALEKYVVENHPYELPEIVGLPITNGLESYLDWVSRESNPV